MKILVYGDNHWASKSSIIRKKANRTYSDRILNQLKSLKWVEDTAKENSVDRIVCLGDFFDSNTLNSEEITALSEYHQTEGIEHIYIVGNHEMGTNDLSNSTAHVHLMNSKRDDTSVISSSCSIIEGGTELCYIPYMLDTRDVKINDLFGEKKQNTKRVVFSHNDIEGIQYGGYLSKVGLNVDDIENSCDLFLNGHLHNGTKFAKNAYNVGNLTGQNFSEDAFTYKHGVYILDTDDLSLKFIENPYAFNFYKIDFTDGIDESLLGKLKDKSVVTIKCTENDSSHIKELVSSMGNIVESRVIIVRDKVAVEDTEVKEELATVDHLSEFVKFVKNSIGTDEVILQELSEVCK